MNTNNTLMQLSEIATRIKELREIMGYSVAQMAEKTNVDEAQYLSYESGKTDIPFSFIHKCALAFDVEMTELLEGSSARLSTYTVTRKGQGQGTAKEDGIDIANLDASPLLFPRSGRSRHQGAVHRRQQYPFHWR